ncbi:isocitrate lyase/phosphoenolpyruvate mutase family protein [Streptomyces sp. NPDC094049]|uniref:isocitrate lyase/phosphoenolpyruvate mutase family protein n=1 Tax=Streptomyces sp. NPDC094049 TaxID=3154987 RepID=UPI003325114F
MRADNVLAQPPGHRADGAARLRALFERPGPVRIVGAHNALGARLAERAGFDGVWSSGLEVSASHALPDADILTMTELLEVARSMAAAVSVPVVADCDAGYGNANNVMHMIRRYEAAGIAAVSIEDKRFPKMNSFIPGRQELAPVAEFAGKIAAAKSAQAAPDMMVIARIEALVAGWGLDEALRRAEAYADAGADAVLIHARGQSPDPVLDFLRHWQGRLPVVVVPTTYHTVTADELSEAGAKLVIYANHGLRASIAAVGEVFESILRDGRTTGIEPRIAPLATVFDLQGMAALQQAEERFLSRAGRRLRAILSTGGDLPGGSDVEGTQVVELQCGSLRRAGIDNITVVTGRGGEDVCPAGTTTVRAAELGALDTAGVVLRAAPEFDGSTVVVSPDLLLDPEPLLQLVADGHDIAVLVDVSTPAAELGEGRTPVSLAAPAVLGRRLRGTRNNHVTGLGTGGPGDGEFIGVAAFSAKGYAALREAAEKRLADAGEQSGLAVLLSDLISTGWTVDAVEIASGWAELRNGADLRRAGLLLAGQTR